VPAGGELSVVVRVLLDDTTKFRDVLHALVAEGADVNIPLEATGEHACTAVVGYWCRTYMCLFCCVNTSPRSCIMVFRQQQYP
jgi:hypothetical protein